MKTLSLIAKAVILAAAFNLGCAESSNRESSSTPGRDKSYLGAFKDSPKDGEIPVFACKAKNANRENTIGEYELTGLFSEKPSLRNPDDTGLRIYSSVLAVKSPEGQDIRLPVEFKIEDTSLEPFNSSKLTVFATQKTIEFINEHYPQNSALKDGRVSDELLVIVKVTGIAILTKSFLPGQINQELDCSNFPSVSKL